jgi:hypothetical protein
MSIYNHKNVGIIRSIRCPRFFHFTFTYFIRASHLNFGGMTEVTLDIVLGTLTDIHSRVTLELLPSVKPKVQM